LSEPDLSFLTPRVMNQKFSELRDLYEKMNSFESVMDGDLEE
jgi:hypothetical protein